MNKLLYFLFLATVLGILPNQTFGQGSSNDGPTTEPEFSFWEADPYLADSGFVTGDGYDEWHNDDLLFDGYTFSDASQYAIDMAHTMAWLNFQLEQMNAASYGKRLVPTKVQLTKLKILGDDLNGRSIEAEYTIYYLIYDINVSGPFMPPQYADPAE